MHTHLPLQTGHRVFPPGIFSQSPSDVIDLPSLHRPKAQRPALPTVFPGKLPPPSAACWYLRWYLPELLFEFFS